MLQRWEPFREQRRMDEIRHRLRRGHFVDRLGEVGRWAVPLDVVEEDDKVIVRATLPGVKPEDIESIRGIGDERGGAYNVGSGLRN